MADSIGVNPSPVIPRLATAQSQPAITPAATPTHRLVRFGAWLNRPRRVLLTLALVWVVSIFDLGFTVGQWGRSEFVELNPIAALVLDGPIRLVVAFKFGLLSFGSAILLILRRYTVAELACWFLLAAKTYVAVRWYVYFDCVLNGQANPFIQV